MICGVTRSGIDPSGPTTRMSLSQRRITHSRLIVVYGFDRRECGTCWSVSYHTHAGQSKPVCVSVLTTWYHECSCSCTSGVETLRGCQLLDPFCCPTQFTHAKAVFSVSRQAFSIMFQGALTFLGQTCCR